MSVIYDSTGQRHGAYYCRPVKAEARKRYKTLFGGRGISMWSFVLKGMLTCLGLIIEHVVSAIINNNPILIHRHPHASLPVSTPNTIHHSRLTVCLPDSLDLDRCLSILFWLSACE